MRQTTAVVTPTAMPATTPQPVVGFQTSRRINAGPKPAPRPAQAYSTKSNTARTSPKAIPVAMAPINRTAARSVTRRVRADARILSNATAISWLTADAASNNWESAVEAMAATTAAIIIPAMAPGRKSLEAISRACSGSASVPYTARAAIPRSTAPVNSRNTHTAEMIAPRRIAALSLTAIKRSNMCG